MKARSRRSAQIAPFGCGIGPDFPVLGLVCALIRAGILDRSCFANATDSRAASPAFYRNAAILATRLLRASLGINRDLTADGWSMIDAIARVDQAGFVGKKLDLPRSRLDYD